MKQWLKKARSSLRAKVALWYVGSIGFVIVLFAVATGWLFWFTLQRQIDHHIHIVVSEAAQIVERFDGNQREALLTSLVNARGMTIVLLSPDGAPLLETNSPDIAAVTEYQLQGVFSSSNEYERVPKHFSVSGIRFAAVPVQVNAGRGILAVGYSTAVLYATFTRMFLIVIGLVLLFVVPSTYMGYRLLRKQLQPLQQIAEQAESINTSSSLNQRIKLEHASDELRMIQVTLNKMLEKLERVFSSEHAFFSDAAHTLKTPLAVLRSEVEQLSIEVLDKERLFGVIERIDISIQDLLLVSKAAIGSYKLEQVSLSALLVQVTEISTILAGQREITVHSDIEPDVTITAQRSLLLRALSNVAHNAVIYNSPQGNIDISLQTNEDTAVVTIADTGIGVPVDVQQKLFDRFYRVNQSHSNGSGLGLSITEAVVEGLQGSVEFYSQVNEGSTVIIKLPLK